MKTERITIRISEEEKQDIINISKKENMNVSEYIHQAIKEKMELEKLNDSQGQFLSLFDTAFKKSFDSFNKHMLVILNRIDFNTRWSLKQQDIFMQHLKIPQTKEELTYTFFNHPITDISQDLVLKDLRTMASKKKELENE